MAETSSLLAVTQEIDVKVVEFTLLSKAIRPSEAETLRNPRARSATLRAAVRTAAPAREAA